MKNFSNFINYAFLIALIMSCSQNNTKPDSSFKNIEKMDSQNRIVETRSYYQSGLLAILSKYSYFKQDTFKVVISYFENGNVKMIEKRVNRKLDGFKYCYYPNGNLQTKCYYTDGIIEGIKKEYYFNSKLKCVDNFFMGTCFSHGEFDNHGKVISNYPFVDINLKDTIVNQDSITLEIFFYNLRKIKPKLFKMKKTENDRNIVMSIVGEIPFTDTIISYSEKIKEQNNDNVIRIAYEIPHENKGSVNEILKVDYFHEVVINIHYYAKTTYGR